MTQNTHLKMMPFDIKSMSSKYVVFFELFILEKLPTIFKSFSLLAISSAIFRHVSIDLMLSFLVCLFSERGSINLLPSK